jgi:hypothetical protein
MKWRSASFPSFAALLATSVLLASLTASPAIGSGDQGAVTAKKKRKYAPIRGRLSKPRYTVIALADNGVAKTVLLKGRRFKLRPPAGRVTLHLRAPDGTYAGPVVLGRERHGKRAIVGVGAGAKLGQIKVKARKGYAKPTRKLPRHFVVEKRTARAKKGVPTGAGNIGLVKSKPPKTPPAGDPDFDGIPSSLDVDDDGDLILDEYDATANTAGSQGRASQGGNPGCCPLDVSASLPAPGSDLTANVDGGSTDAQVVAGFREMGVLEVGWGIPPIDLGSGELDCGGAPDPNDPEGWIGGLSYCTRGGSGELMRDPFSATEPFPECCDSDGDGYGAFVPFDYMLPGSTPSNSSTGGMQLRHRTTPDAIHAGDVLIEHAKLDGQPTDYATTVGSIFATSTAFASYDDGDGRGPRGFSYAPNQSGPRLGSEQNPAPIKARPNGDLVLTLAVWPPQRLSVGKEPPGWVDVGHVVYTTSLSIPDHGGGFCPQETLSTTDLNLSPYVGPPIGPPSFHQGGFLDNGADQASDPDNVVTYTLNVTQCLAANGLSAGPGDRVGVGTWAYFFEAGRGSAAKTTSGVAFLIQ